LPSQISPYCRKEQKKNGRKDLKTAACRYKVKEEKKKEKGGVADRNNISSIICLGGEERGGEE